MASEEHLKELMQTLDDAWNAQDLDTFAKRHRPDTVVRWAGQPATNGVEAHKAEALDFFRAFPNQHVHNRPYKVLIAPGDWTRSVAHFTGTMSGPMNGPDGTAIPPRENPSRWTSARSPDGTTTRSPRRTSFMTSSRSLSRSVLGEPLPAPVGPGWSLR